MEDRGEMGKNFYGVFKRYTDGRKQTPPPAGGPLQRTLQGTIQASTYSEYAVYCAIGTVNFEIIRTDIGFAGEAMQICAYIFYAFHVNSR